MNKKTILTIAVIGVLGYWIYSRRKANKSLNPFAKSSNFTTDEETFYNAVITN